jgi:electron transfer flavoprotein alpha subunit
MNGINEQGGICVFSEAHDLTLEMLGKARELADKLRIMLTTVHFGKNAQEKAKELLRYGADKVYAVDNPALETFQTEAYLNVLTDIATRDRPEILMIGSTRNGKPLAARLATRLDAGCVPDCISLDVDDSGRLIGERIAYGGNALARVAFKSKPQIVTVPARTFEKPAPREHKGEIVKLDTNVEPSKVEVVERKPLETSSERVEEAEVIVSCGRGLEKKDDVALLKQVAEVVGGQVGCSRPLVEDRKWFSEWIGLSGHKVKPKLYIASGVSGVIQHVAGIRDAKIIVAINKDPEAPIFEIADYGVVGDLYEVLPALKDALKKHLQ